VGIIEIIMKYLKKYIFWSFIFLFCLGLFGYFISIANARGICGLLDGPEMRITATDDSTGGLLGSFVYKDDSDGNNDGQTNGLGTVQIIRGHKVKFTVSAIVLDYSSASSVRLTGGLGDDWLEGPDLEEYTFRSGDVTDNSFSFSWHIIQNCYYEIFEGYTFDQEPPPGYDPYDPNTWPSYEKRNNEGYVLINILPYDAPTPTPTPTSSVTPTPTASITPTPTPTPTCSSSPNPVDEGVNTTFTVTNGTAPFSWSTPGGSSTSGTGTTHTVSYGTEGTKTATVTDHNNHTSTCTVVVEELPPVLSCSSSPSQVVINTSTTFTATGGTAPYSWSTPGGSSTSGTGETHTVSYSTRGTKIATVTDSLSTVKTCTVQVVNGTPEPSADIDADGVGSRSGYTLEVTYGGTPDITWSWENVNSCTISINGTPTSNPLWWPTYNDDDENYGSHLSPPLYSQTTFAIDCTGPYGPAHDQVTVNVATPISGITCGSPGQSACTIDYGASTPIAWTSNGATSCLVKKGTEDFGTGVSGTKSSGALTANATYTLKCQPSFPDKSVTVTVRPPTVDLTASPTQLTYSNSGSNLSWSVSNAGSCTASATSIDGASNSLSQAQLNDIWSGSKSISGGTQSTGALQTGVSPGMTYTFVLTCTGNGSASDSATVLVTPSTPGVYPPVVGGDYLQGPDYCSSGPAMTVSWLYSDPNSVRQDHYQIQVYGSSNNLIYDSCNPDPGVTSTCTTGYVTRAYDPNPVNRVTSWVTPLGKLNFNKTYKAKIKVWNLYNSPSSQVTTENISTPSHAYPQVGFHWSPTLIYTKSPIQFIDDTDFASGANNKEWNWNFGDTNTSIQQSPTHTYDPKGDYNVTLRVKDDATGGVWCSLTKSIKVRNPAPIWIEIAPK